MEKVFQSGTPDSETDRFSTLLGLLITFASFKIRYRRRGFRREKKTKTLPNDIWIFDIFYSRGVAINEQKIEFWKITKFESFKKKCRFSTRFGYSLVYKRISQHCNGEKFAWEVS